MCHSLQGRCRLSLCLTFLFLLVASAFLLFYRLSDIEMRPWDESLYSQRAKEMYLSGSFLAPTQGGKVAWASGKPPFGFWLITFSFHLFGVSPWALRLPFALAGSGCVLLLFLIGQHLADRRLGLLAAISLLLMPGFLTYSRQAILEPILMLLFLAALLLFSRSHSSRSRRGVLLYSLATGLLIGLAILTKQAVGLLILPALILCEIISWSRGEGEGRLLRLFSVVAAMLASSLWWFAAMYARYGSTFLQHYFQANLLRRLTTTITAADRMAQGFHSVLLQRTGSLPFLLGVAGLLLLLCFLLFPRILRQREFFCLTSSSPSLLIPLFLFSGTYYLVFGLISRTLLSWYPLPLLPTLALGQGYLLWIGLAAAAGKGSIKTGTAGRTRTQVLISALALIVVAAYFCGLASLVLRARTYHSPDPFKGVAARAEALQVDRVLFDEGIERGQRDKILPLRFYVEVPVERAAIGPYLDGERKGRNELIITSEARWREWRATSARTGSAQILPGGELVLWEVKR
jgi:4-amino-4-deoxy-L-arabinose transferase-like glycosyltransferase